MKTRFCPSPSGSLHLGNVRTALLCYLAAAGSGGCFVLRVEDTDAKRSRVEHIDGILEDLRWLGLAWQEGYPDLGDNGPYLQSQRGEIYAEQLARLVESGQVYRCYCSSERLEELRVKQAKAGLPPRYDNKCRHLSAAQHEEYAKSSTPYVMRFAVPEGRQLTWQDVVKGETSVAAEVIGDFVISRSDKTFGFLFTNAVDDALMGINLVIRGEDHLTNTASQLLLTEALGFPVARYAHVGLVFDVDGSPLSKRRGSIGLRELRADGFLPQALVNYLARMGNGVAQDADLTQLAGLAEQFQLAKVAGGPVRYDVGGLEYWQRMSLQALSADAVKLWAAPILAEYPEITVTDFIVDIIAHNCHDYRGVRGWLQALSCEGYDFTVADLEHVLCEVGALVVVRDALVVKQSGDIEWLAVIGDAANTAEIKKGVLMKSLRYIVTKHQGGPGLVAVLDYLGVDEVVKRVGGVIELLHNRSER